MAERSYSLDDLLDQRVVLDTAGPLIYIGLLVAQDDRGYWLRDADVHDRTDGHSTKEEYINEAHVLERDQSRRTNRRKVFVERSAVVSVSALADVVAGDDPDALDDADERDARWL